MSSLKPMAEDAKKKKSITPKKPAKKVSPPPNLSTEFVQESDLEEDEDLDEASTSDDEESLPDTPALPVPKSKGKTAVPAADSGSSESENESADDSESEDSEDKDEEPSSTVGKHSAESRSAKSASTAKTVSFKAAPYKPPPGYELASVDGPSCTSQLFHKSNLEGKQIWYITAPASVPLSSIKEASLAKIQKGSVILSHNDNDYGLVNDSSEDVIYTKVMVPNSAEDDYRAATRSIDRILKLKEIVQLPSVYNASEKEAGSSTSEQAVVSIKKPVRPQPPGLKMRFRPIGFGDGKLGTIGMSPPPAGGDGKKSASDEEMEDASQQFRRPASLEQEESATSSTSDDESSSSSDAEMADAPPLKSEPAVKLKPQKSAAKESANVANQSLKRKASEGGDMKSKNCSSSSATPTNRELNTVKKKQKNSPADSQSVSTEAHNTTSSKLPHSSKSSTSLIRAPGPKQSHSSPNSSSQNLASPAKAAPIRSPDTSQISPSRNSQSPGTHLTSRQASEMPSQEPPTKAQAAVLNPELSAKERKKEAKRLKKDKSKLLSKSDVGEPATRQSDAGKSSSQVQNLFGEESTLLGKHKSKDGKKEKKKRVTAEIDEDAMKEKKKRKTAEMDEDGRKEKKKRKTTKMETGQAKDPVPSVHNSTPILTPQRSLSTRSPPNGTS